MSSATSTFNPGSLIKARGREWVVQPESTTEVLALRPLGGSDEDLTYLIPDLEESSPASATFPSPDPRRHGSHQSAALLRDAIQLALRNGAGPFRSFGNIAVEPRAYQLVPLLMALHQPTIRLLIADDVGIGKTIEAGLIARELLDRGEITRLAVLCPPHLVEQWQSELESRFHMKAVALTSSSATRLERDLPPGVKLFDHYPFAVVSLDYIKSERHREHFLSIAPECIIVDEAHSCTSIGSSRQLRFELLQKLAEHEERHMILLTATPHSGNNDGFYNLLSLLRPEFGELRAGQSPGSKLREQLAKHFVQRRRIDIEEWQDTSIFPRRFTAEETYTLSGEWGEFFEQVRDYCVHLATRTEEKGGQAAGMIWYATLAMLRCVSSSPAAAAKALTTRLEGFNEETSEVSGESLDEHILDGEGTDLSLNDLEPAAALEDESTTLQSLIDTANSLAGAKGDPKLAKLIDHLKILLKDGFRPVVFCRYVATAHYVAEHLKEAFKKATVEAVTGELTPDEREERVSQLGSEDQPILVATDCLSEGINLQRDYTAVVHYDLAWNPSRHEQREGRVDRFGQRSPEVRATMIYGQDNPVDGFILRVILRKAEEIRKELGVSVPLPTDESKIHQALIRAALLKKNRDLLQQDEFDFGDSAPVIEQTEIDWNDVMESAKRNRTIFAQNRLSPEEVLPEWEKQRGLLGGGDDILRFVRLACARLNAPLESSKNESWELLPEHLPTILRERLALENITKPTTLYFDPRNAVPGGRLVDRTHPLVTLLADHLLEDALGSEDHPLAARCSATVTEAVTVTTCLFVLRFRHQLTSRRKDITRTLMAEECVTIAAEGRKNPTWLSPETIEGLLKAEPAGNLAEEAATREIQSAIAFMESQTEFLETLAQKRADELLDDHRRVREAAADLGRYTVSPCLPVDVMGAYILLPASL